MSNYNSAYSNFSFPFFRTNITQYSFNAIANYAPINNILNNNNYNFNNKDLLINILNTNNNALSILLGTSKDDYITGDTQNNILLGGNGADYLSGCAGDDTYIVNNINDRLYESENNGTDTVKSYLTHHLGDNFENLEFLGNDAFSGYGNELDNNIKGNDLNNTIYGSDGNDVLEGAGGDDSLFGETGNDYLLGQDGSDQLYGDDGNDCLEGGAGNDKLFGDAGNDHIIGGTGNDFMNDTSGSDLYSFSKGDGKDTIQDQDLTGEDIDIVEFTESINKEDIAVFMQDNDLVVAYGTNDQITIKNQTTETNGIEMLQLADGNFLTNDDINLIIQEMTAYADTNGFNITSIEQVQNNPNLMNIVVDAWG